MPVLKWQVAKVKASEKQSFRNNKATRLGGFSFNQDSAGAASAIGFSLTVRFAVLANNFDCQTALRGFTVLGIHVFTGFQHSLDNFIQRYAWIR